MMFATGVVLGQMSSTTNQPLSDFGGGGGNGNGVLISVVVLLVFFALMAIVGVALGDRFMEKPEDGTTNNDSNSNNNNNNDSNSNDTT